MKAIPYISFNGNCEEAVRFYQSVLGGEIFFMRFRDIPPEGGIPISDQWKEKIMHGSITFEDGNVIYFGDAWENASVATGTNTTIHLSVDAESTVYNIVEKLSAGGEVLMPADKVFWGSVYGNCRDKFGVLWGVEYELGESM